MLSRANIHPSMSAGELNFRKSFCLIFPEKSMVEAKMRFTTKFIRAKLSRKKRLKFGTLVNFRTIYCIHIV